jgi:two-component system, NarL family, response regulator NreC
MKGRRTVPPQIQIPPEELSTHNKTRCLLVHDYVLLRQGLRRLLEDEPDIEIVAESVNAAEALRHIFEHRPHVVIAAPHLFEDEGDGGLGLIQRESPQTRVLFLSAGAGEDRAALVEGTSAATRATSADGLVEMIRGMHPDERGMIREMPRIAGEWLSSESGRPRKRVLTAREREVLKLLAEGRTVRSTAGVLGLSVKTVDAHKFNLMRKLGIHNKAELVMWAIQKRVVKLPANF